MQQRETVNLDHALDVPTNTVLFIDPILGWK